MKIINATFPNLPAALPFLRLVTRLCLSYSVAMSSKSPRAKRVVTVDALTHHVHLVNLARKSGATRVEILERK